MNRLAFTTFVLFLLLTLSSNLSATSTRKIEIIQREINDRNLANIFESVSIAAITDTPIAINLNNQPKLKPIAKNNKYFLAIGKLLEETGDTDRKYKFMKYTSNYVASPSFTPIKEDMMESQILYKGLEVQITGSRMYIINRNRNSSKVKKMFLEREGVELWGAE